MLGPFIFAKFNVRGVEHLPDMFGSFRYIAPLQSEPGFIPRASALQVVEIGRESA